MLKEREAYLHLMLAFSEQPYSEKVVVLSLLAVNLSDFLRYVTQSRTYLQGPSL